MKWFASSDVLREPIMKKLLVLFVCLSLLAVPLVGMAADPVDPLRFLIVVGPSNHPPGTHEAAAGGRLMKHCLDNMANMPGVHADVVNQWPDKGLRDKAASIVFIGDTFPPNRLPNATQNLADLDEMMQRGCGIVCVHYATGLLGEDVKPDGDHPLLKWMGGYFANRSCPHHESFAKIFPAATITPAAPQHPIWRGCNEFTVNDEPYTNNYFSSKGNKPLANVTVLATSMLPPEAPKPETVSWCIERTDSGRGFAVVMPHFYRNWKEEQLRRYILNGIVWSAKLDVPAGGIQTTLPDMKSFEPAALEPMPPAPKVKPTLTSDYKPDKPPANIDLTHWKLTLPISSADSDTNPLEFPADRIAVDHSYRKYIQLASDGALVFWCPVNGVTTKNAKYPRCELRELVDPHDDNVCWSAPGTHILDATCRMIEVPSSQKVIIGQIHGHSGKAQPLIKLQYFKGRIEALVKEHASRDKETKLTFPQVGLEKDFDYQIRLQDGVLNVTVNNQTQSVNVFANDSQWSDQTLYFKAGAYVQDNEGSATEAAKVRFSKLKLSHS